MYICASATPQQASPQLRVLPQAAEGRPAQDLWRPTEGWPDRWFVYKMYMSPERQNHMSPWRCVGFSATLAGEHKKNQRATWATRRDEKSGATKLAMTYEWPPTSRPSNSPAHLHAGPLFASNLACEVFWYGATQKFMFFGCVPRTAPIPIA